MNKRTYKKKFKTNQSFQKAQIHRYNCRLLNAWQPKFVSSTLYKKAEKIRTKVVRYYLKLGVRWRFANFWYKYGNGGRNTFNAILKERSIVYFYPKKINHEKQKKNIRNRKDVL